MTWIEDLLGLTGGAPNDYQMACRAFVVFFLSLAFVRIAGIRIFGKQTAFDTLTALMLGAIMGRACVSDQSFAGHLFAALVIMLLHRLVAWVTFHSRKAGKLLKGKSVLLWKQGSKQEKNLKMSQITDEDILEALRKHAQLSSFENVREIYLERSGDISVVKK